MKTEQTKGKIKRITDWAQLQLFKMEGVRIAKVYDGDALEWNNKKDDQYKGLQVMRGYVDGSGSERGFIHQSARAIVQEGKSVHADTKEFEQECDLLLHTWHKGFYFLDGVKILAW